MIEYYRKGINHVTIEKSQHAGLWGHFPLVFWEQYLRYVVILVLPKAGSGKRCNFWCKVRGQRCEHKKLQKKRPVQKKLAVNAFYL